MLCFCIKMSFLTKNREAGYGNLTEHSLGK